MPCAVPYLLVYSLYTTMMTRAWVFSLSFPTLTRVEFIESLMMATSSVMAPQSKADELTSCQNGALVPEMAVPGAYNQVCMNLPERVLDVNGKTIRIQQEASGSGKTGLAVWNSGLLLTRLLEELAKTKKFSENFNTVLELGCGTALVSIAAETLGATQVIATDGNPDVVRLAQRNIQLNRQPEKDQEAAKAVALQWGLLDAMDYSDTADLVVGSDLTYNSGTWRVLCETMVTVVKPDGYILYLSLGHEGFNVNAELDGFLSVAKEVGLVEVKELNGVSISNLLPKIVSPVEAKQLAQSGGARAVVLRRKQFRNKSNFAT